MRTFALALTVFLLIIGILFFSGRYLIGKAAALSLDAKNLPSFDDLSKSTSPETFRARLSSFVQKWKDSRAVIHILAGHEEADQIDAILIELQIRFVTHDTTGYLVAREQLLHSLSRLADSESLTFDSVT